MKHYEPSSKVLVVEPSDTQWGQIEAASQLHFPGTDFVRAITANHALKQLNKWIYGECTGPRLILVNADAMDGKACWEMLTELKASESAYNKIPVLVFCSEPNDIRKAYQLKVNSCITPPTTKPNWQECFRMLREYWWEIATLPAYLL